MNTRDLNEAPPIAFNRARGITYPSIYDPSGRLLLLFAGTLPATAIPSTLIIDADGQLAARIVGPVAKATLVSLVEDVSAGR